MSATEVPPMVELLSVRDSGEDAPSDQEPQPSPQEKETSTRTKISTKIKHLIVGASEENSEGGPRLRKEVTLLSGIAMVTGNLIGSGIFITPHHIFCNTGSFGVSMIAWVIGAVIALASGICYIEIGLVVKSSGGDYAALVKAYSFNNRNKYVSILGKLLGFTYSWASVVIIRSMSLSIMTLTCARYLSTPFFTDCQPPQAAVTVLALAVLMLVALVNSVSVKLTSKVVTVLSGLKLLSLLFITLVGIIHIIINRGFPPDVSKGSFNPYPGLEPTVPSIALALYGVTYAYDGWNVIVYAYEETKNVERTLPLSMFIGIILVALCYLLVNVAYFGVVTYTQIANQETIALVFGHQALGPAGLVVIPILVSLSTFGSALLTVYTGSRGLFAAARDGIFPKVFSSLHTTLRTPIPAIWFIVFLAGVYVCIGEISFLLSGQSVVAFVIYGLIFFGLIIMRITHKEEPRPFKVWFIIPLTVFSICVCVFLVIMPLFQYALPSAVALLITLAAIAIYPLFLADTPWRAHLAKLSDVVTNVVTKVLNAETTTKKL